MAYSHFLSFLSFFSNCSQIKQKSFQKNNSRQKKKKVIDISSVHPCFSGKHRVAYSQLIITSSRHISYFSLHMRPFFFFTLVLYCVYWTMQCNAMQVILLHACFRASCVFVCLRDSKTVVISRYIVHNCTVGEYVCSFTHSLLHSLTLLTFIQNLSFDWKLSI